MDKAPFTLSRATLADMDEITNLEYDCFDEFVRRVLMGCKSRDDVAKVSARQAHAMKNDPNDVWIKVVDKSSGKIIAASNWKVHLNGPPMTKWDHQPPEGLEAEDLEKAREILGQFNSKRAMANPGPFIHLHICFTSGEYRRRGAGGMMMKWGCDLADLLDLPGWIEASAEGNFLYKTYGFYVYEELTGDMAGGTNMRRDPRPLAFEGGK